MDKYLKTLLLTLTLAPLSSLAKTYSPQKQATRISSKDGESSAVEELHVLEYHPAPGQFINALPAWEEGMSDTDMLKACEEQLADGNPVCLGAFGGYITIGFSQPVENKKGSDLRILGNAFYTLNDPVYGSATIGGSMEPGIVYAGVGSSPETAEWYELAGSEYYTAECHDFSITYHRPTAEQGEHSLPYSTFDNYIAWTASWTDGNGTPRDTTGYIIKNAYHTQTYYPSWLTTDELTFHGSRLPDNAINYGGDGSDPANPQNWISYRYAADAYGYVDAAPNDDPMYNTFDLDWAVDAEGEHVQLDHADFIRIQTAVLQQCGWIGEQSTEITAIENLHLIPGYDDNPIVITQRKRPTSVNGIKDSVARETMRFSADGQRLAMPAPGVNIVRYSDGTTRKVVVRRGE